LTHAEQIIFGALIVWFLIVEPHGLAKLWSVGKQKNASLAFPSLMSFDCFVTQFFHCFFLNFSTGDKP